MSSIEERRQELVQKTFRLMLRILLIFGIPAFVGYFVGEWIDTTYDVRPNGTVGVLAITFVISWAMIIRMWKKLNAQFKALDEEERQQEEDTHA